MKHWTNILAATLAAGAIATPAAAQYPYPAPYPPQPYPGYGYPGYGQNPIGTIIDQLLGNRYNVTDRGAVSQCASAAVVQAQNQYRGYGYNQPYGGYNPQYGYNAFRVTAITDVERRSRGLRVNGLMTSGAGYGYNQGYGELSFRCDVDYRGYVSNVRVRPNIRRY